LMTWISSDSSPSLWGFCSAVQEENSSIESMVLKWGLLFSYRYAYDLSLFEKYGILENKHM
jgi:hypothetical protein